MLPSGIDIRVTLIKEKPDFYMMGPNSHGTNLSIDHKTINPEILYAHHQVLNTKNMILPYKRTAVKQHTVSNIWRIKCLFR